jgi:hypothetical protein
LRDMWRLGRGERARLARRAAAGSGGAAAPPRAKHDNA